MDKKHTLIVEKTEQGANVKITGVTGVTMLLEREATLTLEEGRLSIRGAGLTANKLDVTDGVFELKAENIIAIGYNGGNKKGFFKSIFK